MEQSYIVLQYLKNRKIRYEGSSQLTSWKYSSSSQYIRIRVSKNTAVEGGERRYVALPP
jgi:hypothetical protein